MSLSHTNAERRLERLRRVLAGREARLAATIARSQRRVIRSGPRDYLQRNGYAVALLLAASAVLPTVLGFTWRHRGLLSRTAINALRMHKLRDQYESIRPLVERGR